MIEVATATLLWGSGLFMGAAVAGFLVGDSRSPVVLLGAAFHMLFSLFLLFLAGV